MKQNLNKGSLILIMTICIAVACKKSVDQPILTDQILPLQTFRM